VCACVRVRACVVRVRRCTYVCVCARVRVTVCERVTESACVCGCMRARAGVQAYVWRERVYTQCHTCSSALRCFV